MSSKPSAQKKKASTARAKTTDAPDASDAPAKVRQTVYLHPATRKQLRLQAVEEDCDLSTVVERALLAYFDR